MASGMVKTITCPLDYTDENGIWFHPKDAVISEEYLISRFEETFPSCTRQATDLRILFFLRTSHTRRRKPKNDKWLKERKVNPRPTPVQAPLESIATENPFCILVELDYDPVEYMFSPLVYSAVSTAVEHSHGKPLTRSERLSMRRREVQGKPVVYQGLILTDLVQIKNGYKFSFNIRNSLGDSNALC